MREFIYSQQFYDVFKELYKSSVGKTDNPRSFEKVMESNQSRLEFLNDLLDCADRGYLGERCTEIFKKNKEFIESYLNGEYTPRFLVPDEIFDDMSDNKIIPDSSDVDKLLDIIKKDYIIYKTFYENNIYVLEFPNNTFNQNMKRVMCLKEYQLAHLLGLTISTQSEKTDNLKKYFLDHVVNRHMYGKEISTQLLRWILSYEGRKEITKLIDVTNEFVLKDIKENPNDYYNRKRIKPNIKNSKLELLKERFKKFTKEKLGEELDFPVINFSRMLSKSITVYNFLNFKNINEFILDYEPKTSNVKGVKEIFLVNSDIKKMYQDISYYLEYEDEKYLKRDIHMLGLDCDFTRFPKESGRLRETKEKISLNEHDIREAHFDTSLSIKPSDLVEKYYKNGRAFFLDHIFDETGERALRIATVEDEKVFLKAHGYEIEYRNLSQLHELFIEKINGLSNSKTR